MDTENKCYVHTCMVLYVHIYMYMYMYYVVSSVSWHVGYQVKGDYIGWKRGHVITWNEGVVLEESFTKCRLLGNKETC